MKIGTVLLAGSLFLGLTACALMPDQNSSLSTTGPYGESEGAPVAIPAESVAAPTELPTPISPPAQVAAVAMAPPVQHQQSTVPVIPAAAKVPIPSSAVVPLSVHGSQNGVYLEISFAKSAAELTPQVVDALDQTAKQLLQMLDQDEDLRVGIVSYTDVAGEGKDAASVGDRRAWRVHAALQADGLTAQQLQVVIPQLKDTPPVLAGKVLIRLQPKI